MLTRPFALLVVLAMVVAVAGCTNTTGGPFDNSPQNASPTRGLVYTTNTSLYLTAASANSPIQEDNGPHPAVTLR